MPADRGGAVPYAYCRALLEGMRRVCEDAMGIRLKLLKIGAPVTVSVRRVKIAFASSYPLQELFGRAHERLARIPPEARLRRAAA
jgi:hypothetical protein